MQTIVQRIIVAVFVLLAVGVFIWRRQSAPIGEMAFYYDLSEKRLYVDRAGLRPPLEGIGGEAGDGVSATVYSCEEECSDAVRRIAYLQKMTPELQAAWAAWDAESDPAARDGSRVQSREYVSENTLLRRVDEETWHARSSPEGQYITSVLTRPCDNGALPRLCDASSDGS